MEDDADKATAYARNWEAKEDSLQDDYLRGVHSALDYFSPLP